MSIPRDLAVRNLENFLYSTVRLDSMPNIQLFQRGNKFYLTGYLAKNSCENLFYRVTDIVIKFLSFFSIFKKVELTDTPELATRSFTALQNQGLYVHASIAFLGGEISPGVAALGFNTVKPPAEGDSGATVYPTSLDELITKFKEDYTTIKGNPSNHGIIDFYVTTWNNPS